MIIWRISDYATLDGSGGLAASGRWHSAGRRIVYCAPNPATAVLEVLVHSEIAPDDAPMRFRYLKIDVPDSVDTEEVDAATLGDRWRYDLRQTRRIGDRWLEQGRTAILRAPSVLVPATANLLINPLHPASALMRIVREHHFDLDPRLPDLIAATRS